jgi:hypothetical protein
VGATERAGEAWHPSQGIPVIGRLPDTSVGGAWPGYRKLVGKPLWNPAKNDAWTQTIIDQRGKVYVGSPTQGTYLNVVAKSPPYLLGKFNSFSRLATDGRGGYLVPPTAR